VELGFLENMHFKSNLITFYYQLTLILNENIQLDLHKNCITFPILEIRFMLIKLDPFYNQSYVDVG